jgi:hypothetical protein
LNENYLIFFSVGPVNEIFGIEFGQNVLLNERKHELDNIHDTRAHLDILGDLIIGIKASFDARAVNDKLNLDGVCGMITAQLLALQ